MGIFSSGSWWVEVSLLAITLVLLVIFWLKSKANCFQNIAYVPLLPSLLISLKMATFRMSTIDASNEFYRRLEGHKIGGGYLVTTPVLIVRDPDLANTILIKDFSYFHDHGFPVDTEVNPLEDHLFNLEGRKWRALRNKLSPTFTSGKLKAMLPQIGECADRLVQMLLETCHGEDVQIRDLMSRLSIDVIASCAFGVEAGALKDPDCEFRRMAKKIFRPSGLTKLKTTFRALCPQVAYWLKMKAFDPEVNDFFFNITRQAFEHRLKTGLKRNDFVDLLLQLKQKGWVDCDPKELAEEEDEDGEVPLDETEGEKIELTDGLLAAQAFIFLVAGWENTAALLSFSLLMLAKHPEVQDKAKNEIAAVKKKYSGEITYSALKDMVYLDACVSETLRMYPPLALLFHRCTKDYAKDGCFIMKGTLMIIPTVSIQMDPAYFQDPEQFIPERFMTDSEVLKKVFLPFGAGPRICIARRFVLLEVKMVLAKVLDKLSVLSSPKTKEPLAMDPTFFAVDVIGGMWVRIRED